MPIMSSSICFILEPSEEYEKGPDYTYYKYFDDEKSWNDAKEHCDEQEAGLVIDNSEKVHNYLRDKFKKHFWIGASDMEKEGEWKWVDRKHVIQTFLKDRSGMDKSFWEDGQPGSGGKDEGCGLMVGDEWHAASCKNHKAPYVCQKGG